MSNFPKILNLLFSLPMIFVGIAQTGQELQCLIDIVHNYKRLPFEAIVKMCHINSFKTQEDDLASGFGVMKAILY